MAGNLVIAQGGGPTAVINASLAGAIQEARRHTEVKEVYAALGGVEGLMKQRLVKLGHLSEGDIERLRDTPASAVGTCRYKVKESDHPTILDVLRKFDVQYFLYNGGNDSMDTCNKIAQAAPDIRVMGIPKTIDNDLAVTDHCPGYGSAARYAAITTLELGLDIRSLPIQVSVIEFMGRNTGWIAAASALARGQDGDAPHLIYFPERPFVEEQFLNDVKLAWDRRHGVVVAVSEGLADEKGQMIISPKHAAAVDGFGHVLPGNCSQYLADLVSSKLGIRCRSEKPGLIGRASKLTVSEIDREEAFQAGAAAVGAAVEGKSGFMVGLDCVSRNPYRCVCRLIELAKVANVEKKMPMNFINDAGNDVTPEFIEYCRPLIGEELPDYFRLPQ